jgi:hypothetical protein
VILPSMTRWPLAPPQKDTAPLRSETYNRLGAWGWSVRRFRNPLNCISFRYRAQLLWVDGAAMEPAGLQTGSGPLSAIRDKSAIGYVHSRAPTLSCLRKNEGPGRYFVSHSHRIFPPAVAQYPSTPLSWPMAMGIFRTSDDRVEVDFGIEVMTITRCDYEAGRYQPFDELPFSLRPIGGMGGAYRKRWTSFLKR